MFRSSSPPMQASSPLTTLVIFEQVFVRQITIAMIKLMDESAMNKTTVLNIFPVIKDSQIFGIDTNLALNLKDEDSTLELEGRQGFVIFEVVRPK